MQRLADYPIFVSRLEHLEADPKITSLSRIYPRLIFNTPRLEASNVFVEHHVSVAKTLVLIRFNYN